MNTAVIMYPGSNADWDAFHVLRDVLRVNTRYVFHTETSLGDADAVVIPGGFSYGDYLRCGAIAARSPIREAIAAFAEKGGPVLGICNGFQILTEMGILPGALTQNVNLRFECGDVFVRTEAEGVFTKDIANATVLRLPIAHAEGRYQCTPDVLDELTRESRIAFRYCDASGAVSDNKAININGSMSNIAGIYNRTRNVLGLMPHPERATESILGNTDGLKLFESLRSHLKRNVR